MKKLLLLLALWSQENDVQKILDRVKAAKPSESDLAFYSLDWVPTLKEAKERGAKEGRPVFFVWVTNISAHDDFYTGHC